MGVQEIFESYFSSIKPQKSCIIDNIYICSNNDAVFFISKSFLKDIVLAVFSKKYFLTIELCNIKKYIKQLNQIADIVENFRTKKGIVISRFEFWLPRCIVNHNIVDTQFIAESYGIDREMALDYLCKNDKGFKCLYDSKTKKYFGLPLYASLELAEKYPLKENTTNYLNGLKEIEKYKERGYIDDK